MATASLPWLSEVLSFLAGALVGYTVKVSVDARRSKVAQEGNVVGGDMAGRDIKKGH